jgi:non-ribosomal peptide synthase protein (TIGR01720 family)
MGGCTSSGVGKCERKTHRIALCPVEVSGQPRPREVESCSWTDKWTRPKGSSELEYSEKKYEAPRTEVEEKLAGIWAAVLRLEKVGRSENFFELGGDSIISLQVVARAAQAGMRFTSKQLFQKPTVGELAGVVEESVAARGEQGEVTGEAELTPIQQWFFEQELPEAHHFNQALMLEAREKVDAGLLEQALQRLVEHHDALRLTYERENGAWKQHHVGVKSNRTISRYVNVSSLAEGDQRRAIEGAADEVQGSFKLSEGPLLKAALFERGEGRTQRLLLVAHHLVVDGVSWRVLLEDLNTAYGQLQRGEPVKLPAKTTSFKAWAGKLAEYARTEGLEKEVEYWLAKERQRVARLPVDKAGGTNTLESARRLTVTLDADETRVLLQEVPAAYRAHINDVLLAALGQALARWMAGKPVLVDLEAHGREELFEDADVSRTVGWFTSMYPVQLEVRPGAGPGEALRAVKETLRRVPGNGVGYGLLKYLGRPEVSARLRALPRAEVSFNYLGQLDTMASGDTTFGLVREPTGPSRGRTGARSHVLDVEVSVLDGKLQLLWVYSDGLHERITIEALQFAGLGGWN